MKIYKNLFAVVLTLAGITTACAQQPQPEFTTLKADTELYLYNIKRGAFFIAGNEYGTRACLSASRGNSIILRRHKTADGQWDGHSFFITNWPTRDISRYMHVFMESDGRVFTDQTILTAPYDNCFGITPSPNHAQAYRIGTSELNKEFTPDAMPNYFLGTQTNVTKRIPNVAWYEPSDSSQIDWAFVTPAAYEKFMQDKATADYASNIQVAPGTDFTGHLLCPNFEDKGNIGDWIYTWHSLDTGSLYFYCSPLGKNPYATSGYTTVRIWQTVRGLPNGIYRVDVQGFNRPRGPHMAWFERNNKANVKAELFAGNMALPLINLMTMGFHDKEGEADFMKVDGKFEQEGPKLQPMAFRTLEDTYVPNNRDAAELAFYKGYYDQSLYTEVSDGQLTLGIHQPEASKGNWTAWDNFRLTYIGNDQEAREEMEQQQSKAAHPYISKLEPIVDAEPYSTKLTPINYLNEKQKNMAEVINSLAYNAKVRGDLPAALRIIERAIELQPMEANYHDSKGEFLFLAGDKEGARKEWEMVLQLNPKFLEEHGETELSNFLKE